MVNGDHVPDRTILIISPIYSQQTQWPQCISEIRKTPFPRKFLKSVKTEWKQGNVNEKKN